MTSIKVEAAYVAKHTETEVFEALARVEKESYGAGFEEGFKEAIEQVLKGLKAAGFGHLSKVVVDLVADIP